MGMRAGARLGNGAAYLILALFSVLTVYPILWVFLGSFKETNEFYNHIWGLPASLNWDNYVRAWEMAQIGTRMVNSVIVTVSALAILLVVSTTAAYALSRLRFPGVTVLYALFLASMMIPSETTVIPLFLTVKEMGLLNTRLALILTYAAGGLAFSIVTLHAFLKSIPHEPEEAALVDGANRLQVFAHVILPLVRPALATVVIIQGMHFWNEFFLALIFVRDVALQTLPLGMTQFFFQYTSDWTLYFAALSIVTAPVIALFVAMQRQFVDGLTAGAVKG
ncbi:carbohydrate ABC transporter permease [Paenibacillus sp. IB182496]|uniref:Carbohydrate ABC transporter permease n=1 Tax=Paenibacillus sabuli TaxID=2772509 RepID=A0A927BWQ2_9BACL|nr:carbohydrate ABC transporter permease [Paenibacillus sabuli]MBD2846849.1 carbohydrate ABC transporter permease [Paenibacillus sabuli]